MTTTPLTVILLVVILVSPMSLAQKSNSSEFFPEYEVSQEATFKGIVDEVQQRICPIVGGVDTHLMIEIGNRNYTVHTAPVKVMKTYKAVFQTGDRIEIIGVHTTFQLMDTILAREIKDGSHDFVLRDEKGKPIW